MVANDIMATLGLRALMLATSLELPENDGWLNCVGECAAALNEPPVPNEYVVLATKCPHSRSTPTATDPDGIHSPARCRLRPSSGN